VKKGVKVNKEKLVKNYPKPWDQKTHDRFMEESGMTEEDHKAYHEKHGGWHEPGEKK